MSKTPSNTHSSDTIEPKTIRVSISEAARLFGINPRTIRRAIAAGEIRYIVVRGRYAVHFGSLIQWSQRKPSVMHKRDTNGIGQWVSQWSIRNPKYSPRPPEEKSSDAITN